MGGTNALMPLSGAPHIPGTMYTAKPNAAIAKNNRVTDK